MWPETPPELIGLQRELASQHPPPWRPSGPRPLVVHSGWRTDLDTAASVALTATRHARTAEEARAP
jgi:hypothetical protein